MPDGADAAGRGRRPPPRPGRRRSAGSRRLDRLPEHLLAELGRPQQLGRDLRLLRGGQLAAGEARAPGRCTRCRRGPRGPTCRARRWCRPPRRGTGSRARRWPGTRARSWRRPGRWRRPARPPGGGAAVRVRVQVEGERARVLAASRSSMLAIRLSCRSSTPSCLRTSRLAAVGWLEKSLGRDQDRLVADRGRVAARLRDQVAQGADVDGGLDRGGGHLARVGLPVDHREGLDLDDVEAAVEPERDQVGLQVGVPAADPQPQQRVVEERAAGAGRGRSARAWCAGAAPRPRGCRRRRRSRRSRPR